MKITLDNKEIIDCLIDQVNCTTENKFGDAGKCGYYLEELESGNFVFVVDFSKIREGVK